MAAEAILVVDDNELNVKLTQALLTREGYQVRTASDGAEALRILETFFPRLILMDMRMPGISGLDLAKRLKADPKTSGIIIIALTAYALKGNEETALSAGCAGYIAKPIDTRTLPGLLRNYLDGKR